ncbi:hypothetical protein AMAG_11463 [Allomyces macrogynus ATCC 38327]|uniref:Fe2OG dioxygenase domain-containing protein n=1 Tax=Allomyces macrogynus (strain ATCC 38327) TaxID=578462 RepID=A0A0L0SX02_ALLM3|nr:hypothetical protein AMAG_11463 [Allomyces macrogynus ATCC 38327]|eukprot:KNE66996.1 hypothetical protein AMAG_11463 [Allomyces macrogynus ATCC 38327]
MMTTGPSSDAPVRDAPSAGTATTKPLPGKTTATAETTKVAEDVENVPEFTDIPVLDVHVALDAPASAFTESGPRGDALRALANQMRDACTQSGFFLIKNYGVPAAQVADMFAQCRRVFALPKDAKNKLRAPAGSGRGYVGIGEENLNPEVQINDGDLKEGYDIGSVFFEQNAGEHFGGATPWPTEDVLPGFRAACSSYFADMYKLGCAMLRVLAVAMGQPADFFDACLKQPMTQLRLLRYPPTPPGHRMTEEQLSCAAHTDYGAMTLLAVDSPGLQILVPNSGTAGTTESDVVAHPIARQHAAIHGGTWMRVPMVPNTLVVNLADMIARLTNRTFHSTMHRVVHSGASQDRYSMPYFFGVDGDAVVQVLPEFLPGGKLANKEIKEVYFPEPVTFAQHLQLMYDATYALGKTGTARAE